MKKKVLQRALFGAPIGLAISMVISIIISYCLGDGKFYFVPPALISDCGNEINAVLLETLLSFLYGAAFAGASVIWEVDNWSILRQTVTHLLVCSVFTFPIAFAGRWMDHTVSGVISYIVIFIAIYVSIWVSIMLSYKRRLKSINNSIKKHQNID